MSNILTATNVEEIFTKCLLKKEELTNGEPNCEHSVGEGIIHNFIFNSERLKEHEEIIIRMIDELPEIEEGQSFLNLCIRKDGYQWAEHINIEQLIALGIATKNLSYCLPKEFWNMLPGGMPYVIKTEKKEQNTLTKKA